MGAFHLLTQREFITSHCETLPNFCRRSLIEIVMLCQNTIEFIFIRIPIWLIKIIAREIPIGERIIDD